MAKEVYTGKLKVQIGRVQASAISDNYFPVVGQTVKIDASTKWGQSSEWQTQDGGGNTVTTAGKLTLQKDSKEIMISAAGELQQKFIARNYLTETAVTKMIYAMIPQVLPYFDVTSNEIVRVGDISTVTVALKNGYTGDCEITVKAYKENEAVINRTFSSIGRPSIDYKYGYSTTFSEASDRGIYDIEVDVKDITSGITFTKRINKLVTITPKLCPKPDDTSTGYEVSSTYDSMTTYSGKKVFEIRLWRNVNDTGLNYAEAILPHGDAIASYERMKIGLLPAGTTLCLKLDPEEPEPYACRFLPTGITEANVTNENGSPNFTYEQPLIITHDNKEVWNWVWRYYGALSISNNLRNIVFDGRGYHNTSIKFTPLSGSVYNTCIFLVGGTSDWEMFGCDVDDAGFAGISAKTDPNAGNPWFWRENGWEMTNLKIHHCTFQNTAGEGVYIGYYGTGTLAGGYQPHLLRGLRLYRCKFFHTGFDPVQINNSVSTEVCYLDIEQCCFKQEVNQANTFSCTMDGKVYNCKVWDNYSSIGIIFPFMSKLEMYNNILIAGKDSLAFSWTKWSDDNTVQMDNDLVFSIYNNIIKGRIIATIAGNISYTNFSMNDNVFITSEGDTELPGYFTGSGNVFIQNNEEYDVLDNYLKVADSANYDYQPNYNSMLVSAGNNALSDYDMRGYKRWYNLVHHSGPLMGIYKDTSIPDESVPLTLNSITLSAANNKTVEVTFNYSGSYSPIKYRVGEVANLPGIDWKDYSGNITYTFASTGDKVLYGQLQDVEGNITAIKSAIITIAEEAAHKAVISIGWIKSEINNQSIIFDEELKINKVNYSTVASTWKWSDGTDGGTILKNNANGIATSASGGMPGATTGDDSGIYPDAVLEKNVLIMRTGTEEDFTTYCEALISGLSAGKYKIRLYNNLKSIDASLTSTAKYQIVVGDIATDFTFPADYDIRNNLTQWIEKEVTVDDSFLLRWGRMEGKTGTHRYPVNIIEIEKI